jgi:hypothetical protein
VTANKKHVEGLLHSDTSSAASHAVIPKVRSLLSAHVNPRDLSASGMSTGSHANAPFHNIFRYLDEE